MPSSMATRLVAAWGGHSVTNWKWLRPGSARRNRAWNGSAALMPATDVPKQTAMREKGELSSRSPASRTARTDEATAKCEKRHI